MVVNLWHQGPREVEQSWAQVRAVAEEIDGASAHGEKVGERREVTLRFVARSTGKNEVVASIVGGLATPWRNVIERHDVGRELARAVRADRSVLLEQPHACIRVRGATGRV